MRPLTATAAVLTILILDIVPAGADTTAWARCDDRRSCPSGAGRTEAPPKRKPAPGHIECTYTPIDIATPGEVYDAGGTPILVDGRGEWFDKACRNTATGAWVDTTLVYIPRRTPEQLRDEALERLVPPSPAIRLAPPGTVQVVNVPTWLAVEDWHEVRTSASVPGVVVTVEARPTSVRWEIEDGVDPTSGGAVRNGLTCPGPGARYDPDRPDGAQSSDCTFTWHHTSPGGRRYAVSATVVWSVRWSATGAPGGGELGRIESSSTVPVEVRGLRAVRLRGQR